MTATCDVAIVGAGPAGLAVAETLAGRGLDVRLLDENPRIGGQLLRKPATGLPATAPFEIDGTRRRGLHLMQRVADQGVTIETGVQVLGLFPPDRMLVQRADGRVVEMAARCTVCATGARERFIPFPGWTLPGVIATGAAQILLKGAGVLSAASIVIGGTGPLPLLLARQTVAHGGRVAAVLDGSSIRTKMQLLRMLPRQAARLAEGAWLMACLAAAGVPVRSGCWVIGASGRNHLEAVTAVRLDRRGAVIPGSTQRYRTNGLAVGFGLVPNIELLLQAGCDALHRTDRGGWVIPTDRSLETSLANVFAAGEVTGIGGGAKSFVEGRLCGLSILDRFGKAQKGVDPLRNRLLARREHEMAFGALLNRMCRAPRRLLASIPDETIICRCEDVRLGDVRRRLAEGFATAGALKKATRCGMGNCQGRICDTITADILEVLAGDAAGRQRPPSMRPPVKMVSLGALAGMERMECVCRNPDEDYPSV